MNISLLNNIQSKIVIAARLHFSLIIFSEFIMELKLKNK